MEFKQYPSYKPSGVEWLGDVPEHWQIVRTKDIFNHRKEEALEDDEIVTAFRDGQVTLRKNRRTDGFTNSIKEHGYQHINSGDLVIHEMDAFAGAIGVSDSSGKSTPVYSVCYAKNENINHHFYSHFFRTMAKTGFINSLAKGIRVRSTEFRWNESRNVYLVEPPKSDQQKIVAFLDTETTRIDNLIAKQEKLIELLEEQRKSIISHAVTKGLNPDAPMKDSGVEWLGKVPNDWNLSRLDAVSKIVRGNSAFSKMDLLESGKYVALQYGKTYKVNEINESFGSYVNQEFFKKSQITEFGDIILISTSETLEDLGHSCFYARHDVGLIGGEQFLLKPKNQNFGKYIYYATKAFSSYLQRYATGLKVFRFNLDDLKKIYIPDISLVEQQKIAEFLDKETARIDISVLKQKSLIEKLKEYRASIISHAVTGKIDVREFGA